VDERRANMARAKGEIAEFKFIFRREKRKKRECNACRRRQREEERHAGLVGRGLCVCGARF
jgi:hypothetical protein